MLGGLIGTKRGGNVIILDSFPLKIKNDQTINQDDYQTTAHSCELSLVHERVFLNLFNDSMFQLHISDVF